MRQEAKRSTLTARTLLLRDRDSGFATPGLHESTQESLGPVLQRRGCSTTECRLSLFLHVGAWVAGNWQLTTPRGD